MKKILILLGVFAFVVIFSVLVYFFVYKSLTQRFEYNGKFYRTGEDFMHEDGCNSCSFTKKGELVCTLIACDSDADDDGNPNDDPDTNGKQVALDFTYEDGKYLYTGTVQKPAPCDSVEVDAVIRESFPEQVTLQITTQASDQICIQVISEEEIEGEIQVSEQAMIEVTYNGDVVESEGVNN